MLRRALAPQLGFEAVERPEAAAAVLEASPWQDSESGSECSTHSTLPAEAATYDPPGNLIYRGQQAYVVYSSKAWL